MKQTALRCLFQSSFNAETSSLIPLKAIEQLTSTAVQFHALGFLSSTFSRLVMDVYKVNQHAYCRCQCWNWIDVDPTLDCCTGNETEGRTSEIFKRLLRRLPEWLLARIWETVHRCSYPTGNSTCNHNERCLTLFCVLESNRTWYIISVQSCKECSITRWRLQKVISNEHSTIKAIDWR